ncbi:MAG: hypothetical protein ACJAYU_001556 [Bradymonadia bacterium]|jgi:hypothetical protein
MGQDENKPEHPCEESISSRHQPVRESGPLADVFSELRAERPADEPERFRLSPRGIAFSAGALLAVAALWALGSVDCGSGDSDADPRATAEESQPDEGEVREAPSAAEVDDVAGSEGVEPGGSQQGSASGPQSAPASPSGGEAGSESALPSRDGTDVEVAEPSSGSASEAAALPVRAVPTLLGIALLIVALEGLRFTVRRVRSRWLARFDLSVSVLFVALLIVALVALTLVLTKNNPPPASPVSAADPSLESAAPLPEPAEPQPPSASDSESGEPADDETPREQTPATIAQFVASLDSSAPNFARLATALRPPEAASMTAFVASLEAPDGRGEFERLAAQLSMRDIVAGPRVAGPRVAEPSIAEPELAVIAPALAELDEEPDSQEGGGEAEASGGSGLAEEADREDDSSNSAGEASPEVEEPIAEAGPGADEAAAAPAPSLGPVEEQPLAQGAEESAPVPSEEANGETPPTSQGTPVQRAEASARDAPTSVQGGLHPPQVDDASDLPPSSAVPPDESIPPGPAQPAPSPPSPFAIGLIVGGLWRGPHRRRSSCTAVSTRERER